MRILVVEDEHHLANALKKTLESERYAVDLAFSGDIAYQMICNEEYDLILLDLGLPVINGLTLTETLRREHTSTPILMLTARDTLNEKLEGFRAGADDYLVKPFDFDELLVRIQALLRRPKSLIAPSIQVNSLTLDSQKRTVFRADKLLTLTAKEYSLLEYLVLNQGVVVNKQQIIDHVWDSSLDPFSNVVDVYIGYLRSKIDKDFPREKPLLKTIKGMGYRLG